MIKQSVRVNGNTVKATVAIALPELIRLDIDELNDTIDHYLNVGHLSDIQYQVVGHTPSHQDDGGGVILQVDAVIEKT